MSKLRVTTRKRPANITPIEAERVRRKSRAVRAVTRTAKGSTVFDAPKIIDRIIVRENPLQPRAALYRQRDSINDATALLLRQFAETSRKENTGAHTLIIHEDRCTFGVTIWPRASCGDDVELMRDAVEERDEQCSCKFLPLYLGATA